MINNKKLIVVMPAYHAEKTIRQTYEQLPLDYVDEVILVDDCSHDQTVNIAQSLGISVFQHESNLGYGGNQKTCYRQALACAADIVVMVHPDYQYDPRLVTSMAGMIASGIYDVAIGSRIIGGGALVGGMPWWKYVANRCLTFGENLLLGAHLSEYHSGYRAYARHVLESIDFEKNSNDFVFDNQFLAQIILKGFAIGEISTPTKYFPEASSINFQRSMRYGFGVLNTAGRGFLHRCKLRHDRLFE